MQAVPSNFLWLEKKNHFSDKFTIICQQVINLQNMHPAPKLEQCVIYVFHGQHLKDWQ